MKVMTMDETTVMLARDRPSVFRFRCVLEDVIAVVGCCDSEADMDVEEALY